jgi:TolB protein
MKSECKYLSLLSLCVLLVLPTAAGMDNSSEYDYGYDSGYGIGSDITAGGKGEHITQNASYYFNSDSSLSCIAAGEVKAYGKEISAYGLVENVTFLTNSSESELFPVWTADGNYILYTVKGDESGKSESYRMKADGSKIERIDIGEANLTGFSDISPYGTELLLTKSINSKSGLYLANLFTGKLTPVTDDPNRSESWGAWCRLGHKIVYTQESEGTLSQLWMVDRDGIGRNRLGTSENIGIGKDWCPLGQKIIYSAKNLKEEDDLWVIDRDGTNQTQLTNTSYGEWNPSFSPDGKKIAYVSGESGKPDIWVRDIKGNYRARLTDNLGMIDSNPKWSPDGLKIVFAAHNLQNDSDTQTDSNAHNNSNTQSDSNMQNNSAENATMDNSSGTALIDYSTNSVTYGSSDSGVNGSGVNGSGVNGSDIAVIKLAPEFAVYPDPDVISINK